MESQDVMDQRKLVRSILTCLILVVALFSMLGASGNVTAAKADYCNGYPGEGWYCYWNGYIAPETRRYFEAANSLRNWVWGKIEDGYGGTVANKCLNAQRGSDGYVAHIACGSGAPVGSVPGWENPSYMFLVQSSNGYRWIYGLAVSPYPI